MKYNSRYTLEICKEIAKKYNRRVEWIRYSTSSYNTAVRNKWLEACCEHMLPKRQKVIYTLENCLESAKKYNYKSEWQKAEQPFYTNSKKNGWFRECTEHMPPRISTDQIKMLKELL